jgi:hypothetical protein
MSRSDTLLFGSIMAMIAMALVFDDDTSPSSDDEVEPELIETEDES